MSIRPWYKSVVLTFLPKLHKLMSSQPRQTLENVLCLAWMCQKIYLISLGSKLTYAGVSRLGGIEAVISSRNL